MPETQSGAP